MAEHTPGPWFVVEHPDAWTVQGRTSLLPPDALIGVAIARSQGKVNLADARLIAAAPELLAVLEKLIPAAEWAFDSVAWDRGNGSLTPEDKALIAEAEAAVAKARGITLAVPSNRPARGGASS